MFKRLQSTDNVAITGGIIGLISPFARWLALKPTRISAGTGLSLRDIAGWSGLAIILGLWLACLVFSFIDKGTRSAVLTGIAANLILVFSFVLSGFSATSLLKDEISSARVSLGPGFWISLFASYLVIFACRQRMTDARIPRILISWTGLAAVVILLATGSLRNLSVFVEFSVNKERFLQELVQHGYLVGFSVFIGTVLGVLLGIWAARSLRAEKPIFFIANITQTIPSLALFGLLIAPLSALSFAFPGLRQIGIRGVGDTPAIIALIIYSLLPIVRNTYVGLHQANPAAIDAGTGMGMSPGQIFLKIEVPLAAPLVLEGVRTAAVQSVGLAAVAALIGAGGLGWFVFQGLGQAATDLILLGTIPIIALALIVDTIMRFVVGLATPKGLADDANDTP